MPSIRDSGTGFLARIGRMYLGAAAPLPFYSSPWDVQGGARKPPTASSGDQQPWRIPPDQMTCLNLVHEVAQRYHREVLLVDVNRAGDEQPLVDQYVGPNDALPLLVRSDGARLDGEENFTPAKVRQFLRVS